MKTSKKPNRSILIIGFHLFLLQFSGIEILAQDNEETPEIVSERIRLSYVDPSRCVELLKLFGVNVGAPNQAVDPTKLPVIVPMPETKFHETVPDHAQAFPKTETDPINEILLFFNPEEPEKTGRVRRLIREQIDLPARKIMIEAMVLEISSQSLDELGVQWDFNSIGQIM